MNKLKIASEKYNDKDVIQVENLPEEIQKIFNSGLVSLAGKFENKAWPSNPSDSGTFLFSMNNGALTWLSEFIETMSGYAFVPATTENITVTPVYSGIVKTGNKLTAVWFGKATRTGDVTNNLMNIGTFQIPSSVADKLIPTAIGVVTNALSSKLIPFFKSANSSAQCNVLVRKGTNSFDAIVYNLNNLELNTEYQYRVEVTFLLSDNLVGE